jgi:hypothetical protein
MIRHITKFHDFFGIVRAKEYFSSRKDFSTKIFYDAKGKFIGRIPLNNEYEEGFAFGISSEFFSFAFAKYSRRIFPNKRGNRQSKARIISFADKTNIICGDKDFLNENHSGYEIEFHKNGLLYFERFVKSHGYRSEVIYTNLFSSDGKKKKIPY